MNGVQAARLQGEILVIGPTGIGKPELFDGDYPVRNDVSYVDRRDTEGTDSRTM